MLAEDRPRHLFNQAYLRDDWIKMLDERLAIDWFLKPASIEGDMTAFYQLGVATLFDNKELGIYEMQTNPDIQLHRNRVQMRRLVAKQCQQSALDGALAVYYDNNNRWRFSFISMEYKLDEQGKLNKQESAPKRFTYLLGEGAKVRTATERFSHLNKSATLDDMKAVFAVEKLNNEFYKKLFKWYERAKERVTFPNDEHENIDKHHSISLIRLLTRLLFVWFIKEKEMVNRIFFDAHKIKEIIAWDKDSSYYKAILQNLFFATLNQEIKNRSFRVIRNGTPSGDNYLVTNIYRYQNLFLTKAGIRKLFEKTPFLNGGLFKCLDREATDEEKAAYDKDNNIRLNRSAIRVDGFSDRVDNPLCVPNELFFNDDEDNPGLIQLLAQYQFTVEESTPLDADVALDPEVLGRVFENLLASYNPETQQTARQASGSYYTPREIVNYMVEESLKTYFAQATKIASQKIDDLFHITSARNELTQNEITKLIEIIDKIKIIDPAVGSGAFPMGILQCLVQILNVIDPKNKQWKQRQIDIINELPDSRSRQQASKEIEAIFSEENHFNDFGRKLYLIEKCIYGVDIQPIAVQIAKLRFFISLAIEQQPGNDEQDNYGIKPMPNLETRFIAANSLIDLQQATKNQTGDLFDSELTTLRKKLDSVRRKHFNAKTLETQRKYQDKDKNLRQQIADELAKEGSSSLTKNNARKIAYWDPYNQSTSADWFNPKWMFGVTDGFDIVIGNPPYINVENLPDKMRNHLFSNYYACEKRTDIYIAFLEKSLSILSKKGLTCFIIPAAFTKQNYGTKMRQLLIQSHTIQELVDASNYQIFENAAIYNVVLMISWEKRPSLNSGLMKIRHYRSNADFENRSGTEFSVDQNFFGTFKNSRFDTNSSITDSIRIKEKIWRHAIRLDQVCLIAYGARLNHRSKKIGKAYYIGHSPTTDGKRFCEGKNIQRYSFSQEGWLRYTPDEHYNPMFPELFENEKMMTINVVKDRLRFAYDNLGDYYNSHTVINCVRLDLLTGVTNNTVNRAIKNANTAVASQFDYKFLLGVLNSQFTNWYFVNFLSEGLHFYPNDAKELPVPKISMAKQYPFIRLVDNILKAKALDPSANTSKQEADIDQLIYEFYGLTEEETAIVKK